MTSLFLKCSTLNTLIHSKKHFGHSEIIKSFTTFTTSIHIRWVYFNQNILWKGIQFFKLNISIFDKNNNEQFVMARKNKNRKTNNDYASSSNRSCGRMMIEY